MVNVERPNVLMIVVDCLRSDRIFGADRTCRTPQLDRLVARAANLPNMLVENSMTAPAFASIFTGCYSLGHGVTGLLGVTLNSGLCTLADLFAANGYRTYAEATGPLLPLVGLNQGFDEYHYRDQRDYFFTPWGQQLVERLASGQLPGPWFMLVHFWELHEPRQVPPGFDSPEFGATTYDQALSALDDYLGKLIAAAGENTIVIFTGDHGERIAEAIGPNTLLPYFMNKLDIPMLTREEDARVHEDVDLMSARGQDLHEVSQGLMQHSAAGERLSLADRARLLIRLIRIGLTRMKTQKRRPGWAGFVELLKLKVEDFRIGWAVFRGSSRDAQLHLLRTTLSQFHLQHGYHIYDYLCRVPFVMAGLPGAAANHAVPSQVRNIDILPTLIELLSLDAPTPTWHGLSFAGHLTNGHREERPLYMEARGGAQATHAFYIRGVRSGAHKLAYAPHDAQAPAELYDIHADPAELRNLAAEQPDLVAKLREEGETMARVFQSTEQSAGLSAEEQAAMVEKLKSLGYM